MADGVRAAEGEQAEVVPPARRYPASSDFPTGPAIGEAFPDVVLRDQHGEMVDLHAARDGRAAFVLFHRSARWWAFCRTQLVQLQQVIDEFARAGVALFAISYDSVPTLAEFAGTRGITYPLLSDRDSEVIRRFGILNSLIEPHEEIYGIPFPGCYVVDANGRVAAKFFYQVYRDRPAPLAVLRDHLGADVDLSGAPRGEASEGGVCVTAVLADRTLVPFQHTPLYLRITDASGVPVEGARIASAEVTGEGVEVGALYPVVAPDGATETAVPIRFVSLETARATLDVTLLVEVPGTHSIPGSSGSGADRADLDTVALRLSIEMPVTPLARRDAD